MPLEMSEGSSSNTSSEGCSELPIKRFQRHRQITLPWFSGHITIILHSFSKTARIASPVVMFLAIAPFGIIRSLASPSIYAGGNLPYYDCTYSGKFSFQGIDLPFGYMTFAQAKAVDLVWDTIVGKALQTVMLIVTYKVFMKVLMRIAERYPVSYELFAALSLSPTRISALWPLSKALFSTLGNMARFSILWLLLSTVYLALFPLFIDAVSGYQAIRLTELILSNGSTADVSRGMYYDEQAFLNATPDNSKAEYGSNSITSTGSYDFITSTSSYISRILPRPRPSLEGLGIEWKNSQQSFTAISTHFIQYELKAEGLYITTSGEAFIFGDFATFPDRSANLVYSICENHTTAQVWWVNTTIDQFTNHAIDGDFASLPHSIGPIYKYADTSCGDWFSILTSQQPGGLDIVSPPSWPIFVNEHFLKDPTNYECISQDMYQWGFSYAWLLIATSISGIWILGTWILWVDAELNSQIVDKGRRYGR